MKILNLLTLVIFLNILFFNISCFAEDFQDKKKAETYEQNFQPSKKNETYWIEKIENYFNSELNSVKSDFTQIGSRGKASGKIFFKRKKGLMKLYYNDPNPNVAIVKDYKLTHFDRDLKEKTVISVYSSPLAFFLEKKIDLKNNTKVMSWNESPNSVTITLKKNGDEDEGAVTLLFSKKPFRLEGWTILESNNYGRQTQITLENAELNAEFSDKEFDTFSCLSST